MFCGAEGAPVTAAIDELMGNKEVRSAEIRKRDLTLRTD
jgi:hypothetical protein